MHMKYSVSWHDWVIAERNKDIPLACDDIVIAPKMAGQSQAIGFYEKQL